MNKVKPQPEKDENGCPLMTEEFVLQLCDYNGQYTIPKLNDGLYLHYKGFDRIMNLDNFVNIKVLYLENNCIKEITGLSHMKNLTCLFLLNELSSEQSHFQDGEP